MQSWADGLVAVLDAAAIDRASIFAMTGAALPAMLLAATHPERVRSLVMWSPFARFLSGPDQSFGLPDAALENYLDRFTDIVGTGRSLDRQAPSWAGDLAKRRCGRVVSASPEDPTTGV
jgi:pimeloyl-ACP methyl ester carboxylesterase